MAEGVQSELVQATQVIHEAEVRYAPNGIRYASFGEHNLEQNDLERMVQAVPIAIAGALSRKTYYFVPLALSDRRGGEATMVAPAYTPELGDQAICHRNVTHDGTEGVFISTRLLGDRFALAFEFFINIAHAFVDVIGVPEAFDQLVWSQALSNNGTQEKIDGKPVIDEKARNTFLESAFSDAVAIYQLSLSVDFDYSELRERESPLLAPP